MRTGETEIHRIYLLSDRGVRGSWGNKVIVTMVVVVMVIVVVIVDGCGGNCNSGCGDGDGDSGGDSCDCGCSDGGGDGEGGGVVDGDHHGSDGLEREKRYGRGRITKNKRLTASATRCAGGRAACKCPLFSRGSARPATLACKGFGWRG